MTAPIACCGKTRRDFDSNAEWARFRYANDPEWRRRKLDSTLRYFKTPHGRVKAREAVKRHTQTPSGRVRRAELAARWCAANPEKVRESLRAHYQRRRQDKAARQLADLTQALQERTPDECG